MDRRILFNDSGTITDFSVNLNNYHSGSHSFSASGTDAIYIGSTLPFNHIYIKASETNAESVEMSIYHWDGDEFKEVVEVIDETSVNGATIAQSGFVSWVPNKDNNYARDDSDEMDEIDSVTIYDRFWTKITFSADITAGIEWMGQLFSDDNDLGSEYPELIQTDLMSAIESGKTSYEEQHKIAADIIIKDLINQREIIDRNQILDRSDLRLASVQKVAELVFTMLDDDYTEERKLAGIEYIKRLKRSFSKKDTNLNARADVKERIPKFGRLVR